MIGYAKNSIFRLHILLLYWVILVTLIIAKMSACPEFIFIKTLLPFAPLIVYFFLVLDCCSVFRCNLREFFVIDKQMNWHEAQKYCRENHSDLATVYDIKDHQEIKNVSCSHWIGLKGNPNGDRRWHWSLPGVKDTAENWREGQPDDNGKTEKNCAFMKNGALTVKSCDKKLHFSCYNGENICLLFC